MLDFLPDAGDKDPVEAFVEGYKVAFSYYLALKMKKKNDKIKDELKEQVSSVLERVERYYSLFRYSLKFEDSDVAAVVWNNFCYQLGRLCLFIDAYEVESEKLFK